MVKEQVGANMKKKLLRFANSLDKLGLYKEANWIDDMVNEIEGKQGDVNFQSLDKPDEKQEYIGRKIKVQDNAINQMKRSLELFNKERSFDYSDKHKKTLQQDIIYLEKLIEEIEASDRIGTIVGFDLIGQYKVLFDSTETLFGEQGIELL